MKLSKYTKFREEKFGGVLFETRSEKVYTLNPTASAFVRELTGGLEVPAIIERLGDRFRDADGAIERDTLAFIAELRQQGLIED